MDKWHRLQEAKTLKKLRKMNSGIKELVVEMPQLKMLDKVLRTVIKVVITIIEKYKKF